MLRLHSAALLLVAVAGSVSAVAEVGPVNILKVVSETIAPDGFPRVATLADYSFPGPVISAWKGQEFKITVQDLLTSEDLDLSTSIHWHGIFQHQTNYADGPAFVTQCPIVPNESFEYKFSAFEQTGTYWYHSHYQNQYCDGLRGPLIIYDPEDPQEHLYDVDNVETVITLADWYHYLSTDAPVVPSFNSTLINGKGRYPGGPEVPLAVLNVIHGLRYRFRLVSISCDPSFLFSIDGHQMTVIEVEGTNVQPVLVDGVNLFAGQRYSVVVTANQPVGNYWLRALPGSAGGGDFNFDYYTNVAVFRYQGAPNKNPPSHPSVNVPMIELPLNETDLHPLVPTPMPGNPYLGGADININLNVTINDERTKFLVNNVIFEAPPVPVLLQILSGAKNASQLLPAGSMYGLAPNQSVELTIPAGVIGGPHPVHIHGHNFFVVRSAGSDSYNYDNPVIRDVVSMGNTGDNVTIRFFTDNPGPWFFHCHIDWHLNAGFAVVFAEDVPDVTTQDGPSVSQQWYDLCPNYNKFFNATGHS